MTITTKHTEIGYTKNLEIIETALRERFGIMDATYLPTAIAACIWSQICGSQNCGRFADEKEWGSDNILQAVEVMRYRLDHFVRMADYAKSRAAKTTVNEFVGDIAASGTTNII